MKIIRKEQQKTSQWSGGSTTELAIFPENAVYSQRNFIWRLSSAVVAEDESVFTALPDYDRVLAVRDGCIQLKHGDAAWYSLGPGEASAFDGAARTLSRGRVTDFNLMLRKGCACGNLNSTEFRAAGEDLSLAGFFPEDTDLEGSGSLGLFISSGRLTLKDGGCCEPLSEGELLLLESTDPLKDLSLRPEEDGLAIAICIKLI